MAGGLLAAHPQRRLDPEAGADQRHRQHRDREVLVDDVACAEPRIVPSWSLSPIRLFASRPVRPIERPLKNSAGAPPEQRPALEPEREAERVRQRAAARSPARAAEEQPGALVAARAQRERGADERGRRGERAAPAATSARRRTARIDCPQPIGDSHDSVPSPASPAARRR